MIFHRLEFEAFMAHPKREVIDFDALNEAGIFLLNGPTGSGKRPYSTLSVMRCTECPLPSVI